MIERFSWILVSDIHLKASADTWSQDVALRELVRDVATKRPQNPRFIIVSGDLAFSGAPDEYVHVEKFLDALRGELGLDRKQLYMVPGNHDVNRKTQTLTFAGARASLRSSAAIEDLLGKVEDRTTLLRRLGPYSEFAARYTTGQERSVTPDGLAYAAPLDLDGFPLCIVGLNSAWLCGDDKDKGAIAVGPRPLIDVMELVRSIPARLVVGVLHHPPDWLQEDDLVALEERFLSECNLIHRGHLHEPGVRLISVSPGTECVAVAAGAGHAGRHFQNSYSIISVDLAAGACEVEAYEYDSKSGRFRFSEKQRYPIRLRGELKAQPNIVAGLVAGLDGETRELAHYLTALLYGKTTDVPVSLDGSYVLASADLLEQSKDRQLADATKRFLEVRNLLLAFRDDTTIEERIASVRERIQAYASELGERCKTDGGLRDELARREKACAVLTGRTSTASMRHTLALLEDLEQACDWQQLEATARRHLGSQDRELAVRSRRALIVSLSQQGESDQRREANELAVGATQFLDVEAADFVLCAAVLHNNRDDGRAATVLREFAVKFPADLHLVSDIGQRVAMSTGDADLRRVLKLGVQGGRQ